MEWKRADVPHTRRRTAAGERCKRSERPPASVSSGWSGRLGLTPRWAVLGSPGAPGWTGLGLELVLLLGLVQVGGGGAPVALRSVLWVVSVGRGRRLVLVARRHLTTREVGDLAKRLGHTDVMIAETKSGRRWLVECSCGYGAPQSNGKPSVTRATFDEAVRTGQWHLRRAVADWQREAERNGRVPTLPDARAL